jgi:hypothetical protein
LARYYGGVSAVPEGKNIYPVNLAGKAPEHFTCFFRGFLILKDQLSRP